MLNVLEAIIKLKPRNSKTHFSILVLYLAAYRYVAPCLSKVVTVTSSNLFWTLTVDCRNVNVQMRLWRPLSPNWELMLVNWKLTADTVMKPVSPQKWKKNSNLGQPHTSTVVPRLNVYELCWNCHSLGPETASLDSEGLKHKPCCWQ